jgi:DNA-binding Lrp family transcriptional regulator
MRGPELERIGELKRLDTLDLLILEKLLEDGRATFKQLARIAKSDQRTIGNRFNRMVQQGIIKRVTIEIDWTKLGLTTTAYMGSTTALGEEDRKQLFNFIQREPRIVQAYTSIGSHEYFMKVMDHDIATLRSEICSSLEPLTSGLTTSILVNEIKKPQHEDLLQYATSKRKAHTA